MQLNLKPKRLFSLVLLVFSLLLLPGCVSIPLTDGGTIEISPDGITINQEETEAEAEIEKEKGAEEKGETSEVAENSDKNPAENTVSQDKDVEIVQASTEEEEEDAQEQPVNDAEEVSVNEEGLGGCANEFYLIVNRLPQGFPIPTCAYIRHLELVEDEKSEERTLVAHYESYGLVEDSHEEYKAFFEGAGFEIEEDSNQGNKALFKASGNGMEITLSNEQGESDELRTEFVYSETPIKKHEIVESIINWTEDGYGKCTDEYYTALSLFPIGFPLKDCAKVALLQIENQDEVIQGATSFTVDRYWTEEFEAYESYAQKEGYKILNSEGLATMGELEIESAEYWMTITTTKLNMEQTETMINVTYKIAMD